MQRCSRAKNVVKWAGAATALLLCAMWIASAWWYPSWMVPRRAQVLLRAGRLHVMWFDARAVWEGNTISRTGPGLTVRDPDSARFRWWCALSTDSFGTLVSVPLWVPAAAALLTAGAARTPEMVARRRARNGRCPKCNYSRAGLVSDALCPECGRGAGG